MIYKLISKITKPLSPELLHECFLYYLKYKPSKEQRKFNNLEINFLNKKIPNPLGIAAGFDKNAEVIKGCYGLGFGFVEVGTVTPMPQKGNLKPRVFKIPEHEAIIQRLGFNNLGVENLVQNIKKIDLSERDLLGVNIGRNKNSVDLTNDYLNLYQIVEPYADT